MFGSVSCQSSCRRQISSALAINFPCCYLPSTSSKTPHHALARQAVCGVGFWTSRPAQAGTQIRGAMDAYMSSSDDDSEDEGNLSR